MVTITGDSRIPEDWIQGDLISGASDEHLNLDGGDVAGSESCQRSKRQGISDEYQLDNPDFQEEIPSFIFSPLRTMTKAKMCTVREGQLMGKRLDGGDIIEYPTGDQIGDSTEGESEIRELDYLYGNITRALKLHKRSLNVISSNMEIISSVKLVEENKPIKRKSVDPELSRTLEKRYDDLKIRLRQISVAWAFKKKDVTNSSDETFIFNQNKENPIRIVESMNRDIGGKTEEKEPDHTENITQGPKDQAICAIRTEVIKKIRTCTKEQLRKAQEEDDECQKIRTEIGEATVVSWDQDGIKLYIGPDSLIYARGNIQLSRKEGVLIDVIYVPKILRSRVMESEHDSSWTTHPQYVQLCRAVLSHYFWPTFRSDIRRYTETCVACQKMREKRKKTIILDFDKPCSPWDMITVDVIGPIFKSVSGNEYILSVIDIFTRYITLIPIPDQTKETILKALEIKYISRFGCPRVLLSDNGTNFCSTLFNEVCSVWGIVHRRVPPWHPQGNGTIERSNREVKKKLTYLCENSSHEWDLKIHMAEFAINNTYNSGIGASPSELLYGRKMKSPASTPNLVESDSYIATSNYIDSFRNRLEVIRKTAALWDTSIRRKRNEYKNSKRNVIDYEVGDEILYKRIKNRGNRQEGFCFGYVGPYIVKEKISQVTYQVKDPNESGDRLITAHADRLKRFVRPMTVGGSEGKVDKEFNVEKSSHIPEEEAREEGHEKDDGMDTGIIMNRMDNNEIRSEGDRQMDGGEESEGVRGEDISGTPVQVEEEDNVEKESNLLGQQDDQSRTEWTESLGENMPRSDDYTIPTDLGKKTNDVEPNTGIEGGVVINEPAYERDQSKGHGHFTRSKGTIPDFDFQDYVFDKGGRISIVKK